jgi:peptidoglycan/xylan/chitin deacetylase (PgdA/CDA1 family)
MARRHAEMLQMSRNRAVLAYHAVGPTPSGSPLANTFVPLEAFERQMDFLSRRRRVVGLDEILSAEVDDGPPLIAITFDDAYRSVLSRAVPVLERHGFPATVFAPTAWLGDRNRWDPEYDLEVELMSEEELAKLPERGVEVGSHGHRHIDFSHATEDEARADLADSIEKISALTGASPHYLAYPYGRSSESSRQIARELGFRDAFALEWSKGPFSRSRTPVYPRDLGWRFAFKTSGHYVGLRRSRVVVAGYALVGSVTRRR